jgi:protein DPCD
VYAVSIENDKVVVRTSNKKYFTKIPIPDLERAGMKLEDPCLSFDWKDDVLVISYQKPHTILELEHKERADRGSMDSKAAKEGDVQCPQS